MDFAAEDEMEADWGYPTLERDFARGAKKQRKLASKQKPVDSMDWEDDLPEERAGKKQKKRAGGKQRGRGRMQGAYDEDEDLDW